MYAPRTHRPPVARRRTVLAGLLVTGLAVSVVTAAGGPAAADSVSLGDEHVLEIPTVAGQTLNPHFVCVRVNGEPSCSPRQAATPGTEATTFRIAWSFAGQTSGVDKRVQSGLPVDCGGARGVEVVLSSSGGNGELTMAAYLTERNLSDGETSEQELLRQSVPFAGTPNEIGLSLCFP